MPSELAGPPTGSTSAVGLVVALQANFCSVAVDSPGPEGQSRLLCTRRARLGKRGQTICVGDRVRVERVDWSGARAVVTAREPRKTYLDRPAVANVARIVVVASLAEPAPDPLQITRFLVAAETVGCPVLLMFSKAALVTAAVAEAWCARGRSWGYESMAVSSTSGPWLKTLTERLSDPGISVLCGPSGVGKSSLLNALIPDLELRVAKVSGRLQRGRHTTRHVELFPLGRLGLVADTPGFNRPGLPKEASSLAELFPEVRASLNGPSVCRFRNCLHSGEPGCVVGVDWERWSHYQHCLALIHDRTEGVLGKPSDPASSGFPGAKGEPEPRLSPQLRQGSRRLRRQDLQRDLELNGDQFPSAPI